MGNYIDESVPLPPLATNHDTSDLEEIPAPGGLPQSLLNDSGLISLDKSMIDDSMTPPVLQDQAISESTEVTATTDAHILRDRKY